MKERIHPQVWADLVNQGKENGLILEEEKHCYTVRSNELSCTDECETVQDILDSFEELNYLKNHGEQ